jgi:hypothetical protein
MRHETSTSWGVVTASVAYATLRYNVFKGVPWSDWPVYVLNKAAALSSLLLLVAWLVRTRRSSTSSGVGLIQAATRLAVVHAGLSLATLTPVYFPAFFVTGKLTPAASTSVVIGVALMSGLLAGRPAPAPAPSAVRASLVGAIAFFAGAHAAVVGYGSWLSPATWPGDLPPITLISAVAGIAGLVLGLSGDTVEDSACIRANK